MYQKAINFVISFLFIFSTAGYSERIPIEQFDPEKNVSIALFPREIEPNQVDTLTVLINVPDGYHITSIENGFFFVEVKNTDGFQFQKPIFPNPTKYENEEVFQGKVAIKIPFHSPREFPSKTTAIKLVVGYQICAEFGAKTCLLPTERTVEWRYQIKKENTSNQTQIDKKETSIAQSDSLKSNNDTLTAISDLPMNTKSNGTTAKNLTLEEKFTNALNERSLFAFLLVFIGGVLASLTPCVYPIIPITIGYIGSRSGGKKLRGFTLSLAFVLGLAIVYSLLGLTAASTGALFGAFTQTPLFLGIVGAVIAVMGISMLGAFDIPIPGFAAKAQANPKGGYWGTMLMGGLSGLVAAPCVGPILIALLAWVAQSGSMVLGFLLLFTFSLGMGLLFIAIGTFSGLLHSLPSAGEWMVAIKKVFGIAMIAGAIFIMRPILPTSVYHFAWAFLFAFSTIMLWGKPLSTDEELTLSFALKRAIALMTAVLAILFLTSAFPIGIATRNVTEVPEKIGSTQPMMKGVEWKVNQEQEVLANASQKNKRILVDFYADWCAACVELDHNTWPDPKVQKVLQDYELLKFDFTKQNEETKALMKKYNIQGLPTVLVLQSDGKELGRFTGFKSASEFITWIENLK